LLTKQLVIETGTHTVTTHDQCPSEWYSRREGVVRGPFSADEITRYLLLGRIRLADELSTDKTVWTPANRCAGMLPPQVTKLESWDDYQELVEARFQVDERKAERRSQRCHNRETGHAERRHGKDRRRNDDATLVQQYLYNNNNQSSSTRPLLLTLLLATMMFAWLYPTQR
jgi:hypothetical protein